MRAERAERAESRVRAAEAGDAGGIILIRDSIIADGKSFVRDPGEDNWSEEKLVREISAPGNGFFVAEDGGRVVGWLGLVVEPLAKIRHNAKLGVGLLEEARGRGLARALMRAAVDWARSRPELRRIEVMVFENNRAAVRLYEEFGFVIEGRRKGAIRMGDRYIDALDMALEV